jgi:hypothetical protein
MVKASIACVLSLNRNVQNGELRDARARAHRLRRRMDGDFGLAVPVTPVVEGNIQPDHL